MDSEIDRSGNCRVPHLELVDGLVHHPASDAVDQTERLGDGDELLGQHRPLARSLPPHERLEAHERARAQVDPRLVHEEQLSAGNRVAQRVLEVVAARHPRAHLGVEQLAATPAVLLRLVEGDVRVAQQRARVDLALARQRDADTRGDEGLEPVEVERLVQRADDPFRHLLGFGDIREVLTEHDELIAPEPSNGVAHAHDVADALRGLAEQHVAGLVSQAVVHHLEVVEIQEEHSQRAAPSSDEVDRVLGAVEQEDAIGEVGESIVRGLVRELSLGSSRLLPRPVRGVEQHGEASDDDGGHDRRDGDDHDLVHVVAERWPRRGEHRGEEKRGGEQNQARRVDAGGGEVLERTSDGLRRRMRRREREHSEPDDIPRVDPLRGDVAVEEGDRVLREVGDEHQRERRAEEPQRRASPSGHEQQPEQCGDEHHVEQRVGREDCDLENVPVVGEPGVHDEELPDREAGGDRDRRAVHQSVSPSLRRANDDEPTDRERDERVREEVEPVGGRHRRPSLAEDRVDVPDRGADHDHRGGEREQLPRASGLAGRHPCPHRQGSRRAGAGRDRRDRRRLGTRTDHDDRRERERREREPPGPGTRQSYHESSSASRRARYSASVSHEAQLGRMA